MTNSDKEAFCTFMASLFSPPDENFLELIRKGEASFFLEDYVRLWGGRPDLLSEFSPQCAPQTFLQTLKTEYRRLFPSQAGGKTSLARSIQRYWAEESFSSPLARRNEFLQRDSALHLTALFRQVSGRFPRSAGGTADHLVVELEFLSFLYQVGTDDQVRKFLQNHLEGIPELGEEFIRSNAHLFYQNALEILNLFLKTERKRLKTQAWGSRVVH